MPIAATAVTIKGAYFAAPATSGRPGVRTNRGMPDEQETMMNTRRRMAATVTALVAAGLTAHVLGAPPGQERKRSTDDLAKIAAGYRMTLDADRIAKLNEEPAIRWTNPVSEVEDAALFLWTCEGRPALAGTFLRQKGVGMYHEFQSLSPGPLRAVRAGKPVWISARPGIAFAPVPEAPAPADTSNRRLLQMKAMAEDFRAEAVKGPPFYGENSISLFRLLPRPLLRYSDPDRPEREGAVFAFVQGTDPEALLILENRAHDGGARWEFAMAPMTGWQARGYYKGKEVWSVGRRHPGHDPSQPYFVAGPFPFQDDASGP